MMKKKGKNNNSKCVINSKYIIIGLIIFIVLGLIYIKGCNAQYNYYVDYVYFENYIFNNDDGTTSPKSTLRFRLLSDNYKDHFLNKKASIYFKCHNKVTNEFYIVDAYDNENGFNVEHNDNIGVNDLNLASMGNNTFEINNYVINENGNNIDYCAFIGIKEINR